MRGPGVAAVVMVLVGCDPGGLPAGVELPTAAARPELAAVGMLGERCGATAIDVGGGADAPAYALTAGHCTGMSAANQPHVIDLAPAALGTIHFGLFTDTRAQPRDVRIAERLYESMLGTDLALVRLDATVGALRARGITPIALAAAPPPAGAPISIASFPSITADDPDRVLHLSRCDQGGTVRLVEHGLVFLDFLASGCGSIRPGSSGGALLDDAGRLFAVVSTQSNPLEHAAACSFNHPCEVDSGRVVSRRSVVYGAPIRSLAACFADGVFDLEHAGCQLTRPALPVVVRPVNGRFATVPPTQWQITLIDAGLPYYRVKAGFATQVRCDDDTDYGPAFPIRGRPVFDDPIPAGAATEPYLVCVQGLASATPTPSERFLDRTIMFVALP